MSGTYSVARTTTIDAPADEIYARIVDLHRWTEWSPWEDVDPDLSREYSGADQGVGARYAWSGNKKAGRGTMEIASATAPSEVSVQVDFEKPMKSSSVSTFRLVPGNGSSTTVTWELTGSHSVFSRIAAPLGFFDKLLGKDFEKGLSRLKSASEG